MEVYTLAGDLLLCCGLEQRPHSVRALRRRLGDLDCTLLCGHAQLTEAALSPANTEPVHVTVIRHARFPAYDAVRLDQWDAVVPQGYRGGYVEIPIVSRATGAAAEFRLYRGDEVNRVVFPITFSWEPVQGAADPPKPPPTSVAVELAVAEEAGNWQASLEAWAEERVGEWMSAALPRRRGAAFVSCIYRCSRGRYPPRLRTKLLVGRQPTQVLVVSGDGAAEEGHGADFVKRHLGESGGARAAARAIVRPYIYVHSGVCGVVLRQTFLALRAPAAAAPRPSFTGDGTVGVLASQQ